MHFLNDINFLAVLVAAVVAFALGALWYSPLLFAKQWMQFNGYGSEKLKAMQADAKRAYAVSFVCQLVIAATMALLIAMIHMHALSAGVKLGVICWLGFVATTGLMANVYSDKPIKAFLLDAGYQLVYFIVMGGILVLWH
ncbi:MAG: DUF1761 domain-containing protein [Gammaproteobacteria bacterium]